ISALAAAAAPVISQHGGRQHDCAQNAPEKSDRRHRHQNADGEHHDCRFVVLALPGDDHIARPVGEPDEADRDQADKDEEKEDADHCGFGLVSAASASAASFRLAAMAALRACAFCTQAAASAFAASGNLAMSASAAAISARAASTAIRVATDAGSSPIGAST